MKKVILLKFLLLSLCRLSSGEVLDLNLDKAISLAKQNNIGIKREAIELSGRKKEMNSSYNIFYPYINGNSSLRRVNTEPNITSMNLGYSVGLNISLDKFDNIKELKREYELGEIDYQMALERVEFEVEGLYRYLLFLINKVELYKSILAEKNDILESIKGLPELELNRLIIDRDKSNADYNNVEASLTKSFARMKILLGIDLDTTIRLDSENITPEMKLDESKYFALALSRNLRLKELSKRLELYNTRKDKEFKYSFIPNLDVYYNNSINKSDISTNEDFSEPNGSLAFSIYYDFAKLLPNSRDRLYLESINRDIEDLKLQKEDQEERLRLDIANYITDINNSLKNIESLTSTLDILTQNQTQLKKNYIQGKASYLEFEDVENKFREISLDVISEKYLLQIRLTSLNYIISK